MELYQLKTFVMVADVGNLTRAAERLHTSQPAVSAHIKALEEELGLSLFARTPKGMQLTASGSILKNKATLALAAADGVGFEARRLRGELNGKVQLGLHIDPQLLRVAALLAVLRNTHPGLELHYLQRMTWEAPDELLADRLDAAFVNQIPPGDEYVAHPLESLKLVVVAPMAWKDRLRDRDWTTITSFPWVWSDRRCPIYGVAEDLFAGLNLYPAKAVIADEEATIRSLVASGVGLTLMMEKEARGDDVRGKLFVVKDDVGRVQLSFIHRRQRADDPLIKAVCQAVRAVWNLKESYRLDSDQLAAERRSA